MLGLKKPFILVLVLATPLLGGCQSLFGSKLSIRPAGATTPTGEAVGHAAVQMEIGRKALGDGQFGVAIAAFRNARIDPDQAAAATNGLAVAYSELGRPDLAERYFREAVALAPGDRRFQANLQLFYRQNAQAVAFTAADLPATAASSTTVSDARVRLVTRTGVPGAVTIARPEQRLVRLSANEVRVGSPAPTESTPASAMVQELKAAYPIRVGLSSREVFIGHTSQAAYRAQSRSPKPALATARSYPLRVELK